MRKLIFIVLFTAATHSCKQEVQKETSANTRSLVAYVNPLMGTDSSFDLSNGNTYPAIATPWGMNF